MHMKGNRRKVAAIIVLIFLIPACSSAPESNKQQAAITQAHPKTAVLQTGMLTDYSPTTNPSPKQYTNILGMEFVLITDGTFTMGSPPTEYNRRSDELQHKVTLSTAYYIQTTEVTQRQWVKVMGDNPSHFNNCGGNCPVENVSWSDIQAFIGKLNMLAGYKVYRLPTEAEWEYACRAGTNTPFSFGECLSTNQANFSERTPYNGCPHIGGERGRTLPVASLEPNPWGIYDMHGNVWEWCQDWMGPYPSQPTIDPAGPPNGEKRVYRGGSQNDPANYCRSALRGQYKPDSRSGSLGFRLAMNVIDRETNLPRQDENQSISQSKSSISYILLRQSPKTVTNDLELSRLIVKYNFYDLRRNPNGTFESDLIDNNDGTITDPRTKLIWQSSGSDRRLYFRAAKNYIKELNHQNFAGYSDWRLPTVEELLSLLRKERGTDLHIAPVFSNIYWSCWTADKCQPNYPDHDGAWVVNFSVGEARKAFWMKAHLNYDYYTQNKENYVKAVRNVQ